jgi:hypothetical protein
LPKELQKFGLPVLQRVAAHLDQVAADFWQLAKCPLFVKVGKPAKNPVADDREQKEGERDPSVIGSPDRGWFLIAMVDLNA